MNASRLMQVEQVQTERQDCREQSAHADTPIRADAQQRAAERKRDALSDLALMVSTLLESRQMSSEATHIGQILNYAFDEIIMLDARTLKIQFVSGGAQRALCRSQFELLGMSLHNVVMGYPFAALTELIRADKSGDDADAGAPLCFEAHHVRKTCSLYPVEVRAVVIGSTGREQLILLANDISERRRTERALEDMAVNDVVTRLPNRYQFDARLSAAMEMAGNNSGPVALMLVEVDRLREIRLAHGQRVADSVLCEFGERLRRSVGASDLAAYLGDDRFAIILEDYYDGDTPRETAVLINDALDAPFHTDAEPLRIAARIGIALFEGGEDSADALLGRADEAVHEAAQMGVKLRVFARPGLRAGTIALV